MSVAYSKFNATVEAIGLKKINLNTDTLKIMLTLVAPVATNSVYADLTEIANGNGYTTGGTTIASTAYSQTSGVAKLTGNAVVFTASGGAIANFRYAVIYSTTATNKDLIGFFDYGATVTLNSGETFTVNSAAAGNWDATNPILSIT